MGDLISRQDAIKAIMDLPNCPNGYSDTYDKARIAAALEDVPSAQLEIVRCKDCFLHGVCHFEQYLGLDGYCSKAERRTDGR